MKNYSAMFVKKSVNPIKPKFKSLFKLIRSLSKRTMNSGHISRSVAVNPLAARKK